MAASPQITYLPNREIDKKKWDACIDRVPNGLIYGYSVYLDVVCTSWDALVLNDYEAVMPLPFRKKWGIRYLYHPFLTAQLGLFGSNFTGALLQQFLETIPSFFRYWDYPLNRDNVFPLSSFPLYTRMNYVLPLHKDYEELRAAYHQNTKRNCQKAAQKGCYFKQGINAKEVIHLAAQTKLYSLPDLARAEQLYEILFHQQRSAAYGVFGPTGQLLSSCLFFFSHQRAYYILVGNHPDSRRWGASHLLIDRFINEQAGQPLLLDFEGSDIEGLAHFYRGFGAKEEKYTAIRYNRLPLLVKWMKKKGGPDAERGSAFLASHPCTAGFLLSP